jgi:hypothetical protein
MNTPVDVAHYIQTNCAEQAEGGAHHRTSSEHKQNVVDNVEEQAELMYKAGTPPLEAFQW